jgi:exopolysaccharide biosynthesis predicted pyruvyltransferase EpsI
MKHPRSPKAEPVKLGKVYLYPDGKAYRVGLLNACRARLDPLYRKKRIITDRLRGKTVSILTTPPSLNISPTSVLTPVITR